MRTGCTVACLKSAGGVNNGWHAWCKSVNEFFEKASGDNVEVRHGVLTTGNYFSQSAQRNGLKVIENRGTGGS